MLRSHSPAVEESQLVEEAAHAGLDEALRQDFAAKGFPSGHSTPLVLADGRVCSLRVQACPEAPGIRPLVYLDQVEFEAPVGRQARWPIEEAAYELLQACPWLREGRARLVVHRPGTSSSGEAVHSFFEVHCTISHGHLIGYGSDPLGGPALGYQRIVDQLGPHRYLADEYLPHPSATA